MMKKFNPPASQAKNNILVIALAAAVVVAFMLAPLQPVQAETISPPPVPASIQVPAGSTLFLVGHAAGTQNYICLPTSSGFAFTLFTPQATLFDDSAEQIITHFFSPNPAEAGTIRATWMDSRDTSTVWGLVKPGNSTTDPKFVKPGAIAWLLVTVVNSHKGPTGGDTLTDTTFIQRLNTSGGLAPSKGCSSPADVGKQAFVPYRADYFFFR